jgi:hypothetical protein
LTELLNCGPLGSCRIRRRIQSRQHSYRQHHTSTPEAEGRGPWQ